MLKHIEHIEAFANAFVGGSILSRFHLFQHVGGCFGLPSEFFKNVGYVYERAVTCFNTFSLLSL